jgi:flagella basal body P-ring formation protein FlgA
MPVALLALAIATAPLPHDLDRLRADIAIYSGGVPLLDPRLALAACAAPQLAWVDASHSAVSATCAVPAWRVFVAVQGATMPPAPRSAATVNARPLLLVRRGDAVTVNAGGQGFSVAVAGVAENDGAAGARIRVRNRSSGGSVLALVGADGSLRVQAQSPAP